MTVALEWSDIRVRLGDLIPNPDNPKYSTEANAKRLVDSIDTLGQFETIAVDVDGVSAVDGNQRLNAWIASKGEDYMAAARQPNRKLTKQEIKKIILLSGKGTHGQWDMEMLRLNYDDVELVDFGGFDEKELDLDVPDDSEPDLNELDDLGEEYQVLVYLEDSVTQEKLITHLMNEGYKCKALIL